MLFQLVYSSLAEKEFNAGDEATMVARAKVRNEQRGITSVLLGYQGAYLQAIEGERAAVQALYAAIRADGRHCHVETLMGIEIDRRLFAGQPMGFYDAAAAGLDFSGLKPTTLDSDILPHQISWRGVIALQLLTRFKS